MSALELWTYQVVGFPVVSVRVGVLPVRNTWILWSPMHALVREGGNIS